MEERQDLISRQAAIDALRYAQHRFTVADEAGGMGTVKWSEDVIYFAAAERILTELPSAQQKHDENDLDFVQPHKRIPVQLVVSSDCISRKAAIEAMEDVDWYHINKDGQLTHGANSKEDEPLYKAEDVYKVLNDMPSAQPEDCDTCKHGYFGDGKCDNCRVRFPSHYERRADEGN